MTETNHFNNDGFVNLLTALGVTGQDKRLNAVAAEPTILSQQELDQLYRGDDIVARICNLPANEMVKNWFRIKATEDVDREIIDEMFQEMKRLHTKAAVREALIWSQLYGGSVIIIGANDGREMHEPLNEDAIRSVDFLTVLDQYALEIVSIYNEPGKPNYRLPEQYRIVQTQQPVSGMSAPGVTPTAAPTGADPIIHESRLIRFDGAITPQIIKLANQGWCDSTITRVYDVVRDYSATYAGVALMMQEMGLAAYRIKGLANALKHDKEGLILTRLQLMHVSKSVCRAIPLDADDESLEYPKHPIQGLAQLLDKADIRLSMALGWPATVLLGQSPKGLNATGESDLTNWYDHIQGEQERNLLEQMSKLSRVLFKLIKKEPKTWSVSFNPLWQASAKDVAAERKSYAEADALNIDRGIYTAEEAAQSRYAGDEFGTEINLDKELRDTDKIPSADPDDVPDLRDDPDPDDEPMAAPQITALMGVLTAYNGGELEREQAIAVLVMAYDIEVEEAAKLVGPEKPPKPTPVQPPPPPTPIPGTPPVPPTPPEPEPATDSIEKRGSKWVVLSKTGRLLGSHETEAGAKEQLRAIEAAKNRSE